MSDPCLVQTMAGPLPCGGRARFVHYLRQDHVLLIDFTCARALAGA